MVEFSSVYVLLNIYSISTTDFKSLVIIIVCIKDKSERYIDFLRNNYSIITDLNIVDNILMFEQKCDKFTMPKRYVYYAKNACLETNVPDFNPYAAVN